MSEKDPRLPSYLYIWLSIWKLEAIDCLSIPVSSFDSFLLKREFSGEFLCLGVCAPPALEFII